MLKIENQRKFSIFLQQVSKLIIVKPLNNIKIENEKLLPAEIPQTEKSVVIYRSNDGTIQLEVQLVDDTVWLTQNQMTILFETTKQNISLHINNAFKEGELDRNSVVKDFLTTAADGKNYHVLYYNLDVIISVGYRVKSHRGTDFRKWARPIIKDFMLRGYAVNQRFERLEQRVTKTEEKIDFFVKTALPPVEGIFYDGQIFDAFVFATGLIKQAKREIVLIDNYIDETVLTMLDNRNPNVSATIYTANFNTKLQLALAKHNTQYQPIIIKVLNKFHDRFLIIDDDVYWIGASLKDLGKRVFAFSKMGIPKEKIL